MGKIKLSEFHRFLKIDVRREILQKYITHEICSEADLQSVVWNAIRAYLRRVDKDHYYRVLNKPYFKNKRVYPDLVVFKRGRPKAKPWIVIELKEVRQLKPSTAEDERDLLRSYRSAGCQRAYLIYVARFGSCKALPEKKGSEYSRFFFEIPIILEREIRRKKISVVFDEWNEEFKYWKYVRQ